MTGALRFVWFALLTRLQLWSGSTSAGSSKSLIYEFHLKAVIQFQKNSNTRNKSVVFFLEYSLFIIYNWQIQKFLNCIQKCAINHCWLKKKKNTKKTIYFGKLTTDVNWSELVILQRVFISRYWCSFTNLLCSPKMTTGLCVHPLI